MPNVYAWPPVTALATEWTRVAPTSASRSAITGRRYVSGHDRERIEARLVVSGIGKNRMGAGYCEALKRIMDGGSHLVRVNSPSVNWALAGRADPARASVGVDWTDVGVDLDWTDSGTALLWFSGVLLAGTAGTDAAGFDIVTVTGLDHVTDGTLIARPGEFISGYDLAGGASTVQVMAPAYVSGGTAVIRLFEPLAYTARISIGTRESAVFEVTDLPRSVQPASGSWSYDWPLRQVFEDETDGFTEVDPWTM